MNRETGKYGVLLSKKANLQQRAQTLVVLIDGSPEEGRANLDELLGDFPGFTARILDHAEALRYIDKLKRTPGERGQKGAGPNLDRFPTARITSTQLPSGHHVAKMVGVPALPKAVESERWSPKHALQTVQNMKTLHRSVFGRHTAQSFLSQAGSDHHLFLEPEENALYEAKVLGDPETLVILAQPDFTQMLLAAALSAPAAALHDDEMLSRNGILFFSEEQDFSNITKSNDHPVRAIQWMTVDSLEGTHLLGQVLFEGHREWKRLLLNSNPADTGGVNEIVLGFPEIYRYLMPSESIDTTLSVGSDVPATPEFSHLLGLFRSVAAITRSTHTRSETVTVADKNTKKSKSQRRSKNPGNGPEVRVLSLINSEYGQYEMDAATGRKLRQHWVRGHWRNQWYSSIQQNRRIWVDGFVRGNASLGILTGPKVHVAR